MIDKSLKQKNGQFKMELFIIARELSEEIGEDALDECLSNERELPVPFLSFD